MLISSGAFNEIGGLHKSAIVYHHLIDAYVPFLPLEKNHIKKCVCDYLQRKHRETNDVVYLNSENPEFVDRVNFNYKSIELKFPIFRLLTNWSFILVISNYIQFLVVKKSRQKSMN